MSKLKLFLIVVLLSVTLSGCMSTKYVERQSEELSQAVWAANESIEKGRVDLVDNYLNKSIEIVKQPKVFIPITEIISNNVKYVIVPSKYEKRKVVTVGSSEYLELIKDSKIGKIIEQDNKTLREYSKRVEEELKNQKKIHDELLKKYNEDEEIIKKLREENKQQKISLFVLGLVLLSLGYYTIKKI